MHRTGGGVMRLALAGMGVWLLAGAGRAGEFNDGWDYLDSDDLFAYEADDDVAVAPDPEPYECPNGVCPPASPCACVPPDGEEPAFDEPVVVEHPFGGDDEPFLSRFEDFYGSPADFADDVAGMGGRGSTGVDCDCDGHAWESSPPSPTSDPSAGVTLSPRTVDAERLKVKIGAEANFTAYGSFSPGFNANGWTYVETTSSSYTYSWSGAEGDGGAATRKFASSGDHAVSVTYKGSETRKYSFLPHCTKCGAAGEERTTSKSAAKTSDSDSANFTVFTLSLSSTSKTIPQPDGSAITAGGGDIVAGGGGFPNHMTSLVCQLSPAGDPGDAFSFEVAFTGWEGKNGGDASVGAPGGGLTWQADAQDEHRLLGTLTATHDGYLYKTGEGAGEEKFYYVMSSSDRIGGTGTLTATEDGVSASVSVGFAWDGGEWEPGIENGGVVMTGTYEAAGKPVDGHSLALEAVGGTVEYWNGIGMATRSLTSGELESISLGGCATDGEGVASFTVGANGNFGAPGGTGVSLPASARLLSLTVKGRDQRVYE